MYADRRALYAQIEAERNSKVVAYVTGDRPQLETQIHPEVLDYLPEHLDAFDLPHKISLVIYSRGGDTLAAWTLANMLRQFCDEFEVIVPMKAHSAATLISLGATNIVMSKQATLGPIDPSVNSPLNPEIPGAPPSARLPVSVEEVAAYFQLFTDSLGVGGDEHKTAVYLKPSRAGEGVPRTEPDPEARGAPAEGPHGRRGPHRAHRGDLVQRIRKPRLHDQSARGARDRAGRRDALDGVLRHHEGSACRYPRGTPAR
jgi:hypothetical protein